MTASEARLRAAADDETEVIGTVGKGVMLNVNDKVGNWYAVTDGAMNGWVKNEVVPTAGVPAKPPEDQGALIAGLMMQFEAFWQKLMRLGPYWLWCSSASTPVNPRWPPIRPLSRAADNDSIPG